MRRIVTNLLFVWLLAWSLAAQQQAASVATTPAVPRLVTFSGTVNDAAAVKAGVAGVTFAIYKDRQGGAALWLETQNVRLDAIGHYTVSLGATKPNGLPVELFQRGEAQWLGMTVAGQPEQPRVLLLSVPYALKAADAETVGGLSPSAFALAAPPNVNIASTASTAASPPSVNSLVGAVTGTGTQNFVPLWTNTTGTLGNSVLFQSGTGSTAKIGINTITPASTLDVKGAATVRGALSLPVTGSATASAGKNSQAETFTASAFNSGNKAAVNQTFRLQAEPAANNTATPSGTLNLMFGQGTATPSETGWKIASNGQITFASGQKFPGTGTGNGTVTSVGTGLGLTGGPISSSGTLTINTAEVPQLNAANTFTGNQTVNGNLSATGLVTGGAYNIGSNLFAFGSYGKSNAFLGFAGNTTTTGGSDTASGSGALRSNSTGNYNTASGYAALSSNSMGSYNTASGAQVLVNNTTGDYNTASGYNALANNITGGVNTASGAYALTFNSAGNNNTASGPYSLYANTTGSYNTASGYAALTSNDTGLYNTAVGAVALQNISGGSSNIAIGYQAAVNLTSGSNNIHIGNPALSSESNTIRIGTGGSGGHTAFYVAGVLGTTVSSGLDVFIGTDGRLGNMTSSRRFKEEIQDMGAASDGLLRLRPVTFRYKQAAPDGSKPLQYGLVAEEVAEIYPELVSYDADGKPYTVKYQYLAPMLLSALQKLAKQNEALQQRVSRVEVVEQENAELKRRLSRIEALMDAQVQGTISNAAFSGFSSRPLRSASRK